MLQCVPQYILWSIHLYLKMFITMSHYSSSKSLAYGAFTWTPLEYSCCSVSGRNYSFGLQDQPFLMPQESIAETYVGLGQDKDLDLSLEGS